MTESGPQPWTLTARWVFPGDGPPLERGTVTLAGGRIAAVEPHGGRKPVPDVPERLGKGLTNFQTVLDANTAELVDVFATELEEQLHGKPWLVVARFERKYLDANRSFPPIGKGSYAAGPGGVSVYNGIGSGPAAPATTRCGFAT